MTSQTTTTKRAPKIIQAGTSLMTWDHKRWVRFEQDTEAAYAVKTNRQGYRQTVLVVTKGKQRGTYAPRGM